MDRRGIGYDALASRSPPRGAVTTPIRPLWSPSATDRSHGASPPGAAGGSSPSRAAAGLPATSPYGTYPSSPRTNQASSFMADLDGKNAVIARLEKHIQNMVEQQGRMKRAHETEIATIESQVSQAVDAHRLLMNEYRSCAADLSAKQTELALAHSEIGSLHEKLTAESKARVELSEQHLQEMEHKQREVRKARDRAADQQERLQEAEDALARAERRKPTAVGDASPSSSGRDGTSSTAGGGSQLQASLQLSEMATRNEELAATIERLRYDLEASRTTLDETKSRYAEDLKRVMREATEANERAVAGVASELHKVREASENASNRDRQYVEHQLRDANDLATRLQGQLEREASRYTEKIKELENQVKQLQAQRDAMMEESQFTAEIQQDYVKEQTQLKAQVSSLQALLREADSRKRGSAPAGLSHANSSHGASPPPRTTSSTTAATEHADPQALEGDVAAMNDKVSDAVRRGSGDAAAGDVSNGSRLTEAEDALGHKDATIASLRGKLETQAGTYAKAKEDLAEVKQELDTVKAQLADVKDENEALKEALEISQSETADVRAAAAAAAAQAPAAAGSSPAAAAEEADASLKAKVEDLEEELENLQAKYSFDTNELNRQVMGLSKKMKDRDADIAELSEENDAFTQRIEELEATLAAGGGSTGDAVAPSASTSLHRAEGGVELAKQMEEMRTSLMLATEARDAKDELLETKEKEFEAQKTQLMDTVNRMSEDLKKAVDEGAALREELDAVNLSLADSEAVCRDALQQVRGQLASSS